MALPTRPVAVALLAALLVFGAAVAAMAAPPRPTAQSLVAVAEARAQSEHKNVLIIFGASWCVWCKLLDVFTEMYGVEPTFQSNFAIVRLDVEETGAKATQDDPGAETMMKRFGGAGSLPFIVLLRPSGRLIATSNRTHDPASNIGYPVSHDEVGWFVQMMHEGAPALSRKDLRDLSRRLTGFNRKLQLH